VILALDSASDLVERLCAGDKSVVQAIAALHYDMVVEIAKKIRRGGNVDDRISWAHEGLMEAIYNYPEARANHQGEHKGIAAYIAGCVRYKIQTNLREDTLVRIPLSSQRRLGIKPPSASSGGSEVEAKRGDLLAINEILKMIVANDPLGQGIIALRRRGFNDNEIAEKMGVSTSLIHTTRKKLEQKFEGLWNA
jgi:DNA-directed RNA polymerase specialized sigma24 family protein